MEMKFLRHPANVPAFGIPRRPLISLSTALMRGEWSSSLRDRRCEGGLRGVPGPLSGGVGGGGPAGGRAC
eukprot:9948094-Heterocapsa_arctica.AAC.1